MKAWNALEKKCAGQPEEAPDIQAWLDRAARHDRRTGAEKKRVSQRTQAQVFATAAETSTLPSAVQQMVDHAKQQGRLAEALGTQFQAAQAHVHANQLRRH